jgi:hypothetical protein
MDFINKMLYGSEYAYLQFADYLLIMLSATDKDLTARENLEIDGQVPQFFDAVADELEKDGLIKIVSYGYYITLKGRKKIASGGYKQEKLWKRIGMLISIVACVAAVAAAIFSAIAAFEK